MTFECAKCGDVFEASNTEEEKLAEEKAVFGKNVSPEERKSLCDDCWAEFKIWYDGLSPEERAKLS